MIKIDDETLKKMSISELSDLKLKTLDNYLDDIPDRPFCKNALLKSESEFNVDCSKCLIPKILCNDTKNNLEQSLFNNWFNLRSNFTMEKLLKYYPFVLMSVAMKELKKSEKISTKLTEEIKYFLKNLKVIRK